MPRFSSRRASGSIRAGSLPAPQPVGSQLVIDHDGNFMGSVSGGCVEGAVVTEALDIIESGRPRVLAFGVADETAWKVGLACGGRIRVYVEPLA
jgi:xanthine/CO dehydrogenase XdhC/CoxF family maturation factor